METKLITTNYNKLMAFFGRQKAHAVLLWIITLPYAEMFIKNGWRKFDAEGFWSHAFLETWGYPLWFMYFIGVVEVIGGALLLLPKSRPLGSLILAVVMVGAVATRTTAGLVNGFSGADEGLWEIVNRLDLMFFISTIATFLFFFSLGKSKEISN